MKHTPGPWIYEDGDVLGGPGGIACVVPLNSANGMEEGKSNAHLIAAAPELLAVLKGMTKVFKRVTETYTPDDPDCEWLAYAHEAIAKAEGRS